MATSDKASKGALLSKTEYLKRYLGDSDGKQSKDKKAKKKRVKTAHKGMKIVDDDVDWKQFVKTDENENDEDDEEEAPVVAEVIDERPEEVKCMEEFRNSNKWRVLGVTDEDSQECRELSGSCLAPSAETVSQRKAKQQNSPKQLATKEIRHGSSEMSPRMKSKASSDISPERKTHHGSPYLSPVRKTRHDSPDLSPVRKTRHDSPDLSPVRKTRHDSPDLSPVRKRRHDSPDLSPVRKRRHDSPDLSPARRRRHDSPDLSPVRKRRHDSPDVSPVRRRRHDSSSPSPPQKSRNSGLSTSQKTRRKGSSPCSGKAESSSCVKQKHDSDSDLSPPRLAAGHSTGSHPPHSQRQRTKKDLESDLSPPRRSRKAGLNSDSDLSPPRRESNQSTGNKTGSRMLSGGAAGLVSVEVLRKEQEENRRRERKNQPLEDESRNAETVFRDKSGKKRNIELEREEQQRKAGEQAEKDMKYMQWGKGLVQGHMQQQNVEDALREAQKPLARHADDEDLDRMLREQEREGDPMADMLRRKKKKDLQRKGVKEKPRYSGPPPPPNRFNIMPGYRWDGVDRSNGFEKQRYSRLADQKAVKEVAYKWSVEDM